jgi:predicted flap endonuclease-1-like 5' DNA nuclease
MSYLLTQMFLYLLVAFLLGLLLGWLIWRYGKASTGDLDAMRAERDALLAERNDLQTNLDACRNRSQRDRESLEAIRAEKSDLQTKLDTERNRAEASTMAMPAAAVAPAVEAVEVEATKPEGLSGPRGGVADDLKEISGVGPKMERLLHSLGYFHFDQIADWSSSDVAWVDENLEGFKGRVSRDNWVAQARELAKY